MSPQLYTLVTFCLVILIVSIPRMLGQVTKDSSHTYIIAFGRTTMGIPVGEKVPYYYSKRTYFIAKFVGYGAVLVLIAWIVFVDSVLGW